MLDGEEVVEEVEVLQEGLSKRRQMLVLLPLPRKLHGSRHLLVQRRLKVPGTQVKAVVVGMPQLLLLLVVGMPLLRLLVVGMFLSNTSHYC